MLWYIIPKRRIHPKINQEVPKALYNWILQHPQILVSLIANDCFKLFIDDQVEPELIPNFYCRYQSENYIIAW